MQARDVLTKERLQADRAACKYARTGTYSHEQECDMAEGFSETVVCPSNRWPDRTWPPAASCVVQDRSLDPRTACGLKCKVSRRHCHYNTLRKQLCRSRYVIAGTHQIRCTIRTRVRTHTTRCGEAPPVIAVDTLKLVAMGAFTFTVDGAVNFDERGMRCVRAKAAYMVPPALRTALIYQNPDTKNTGRQYQSV